MGGWVALCFGCVCEPALSLPPRPSSACLPASPLPLPIAAVQSGVSRELFEAWCEDPRNCVIIADFAVQGTLARDILGNPSEVMTRNGVKVRLDGRGVGGAAVGACVEPLAQWSRAWAAVFAALGSLPPLP